MIPSISSFLRLSTIALILCFLTACVSTVRTTVSTFNSPNTLPRDASFAIQFPADAKQDVDELEFAYFASRLATQLKEQGFGVASESNATHRLILQYDTQRQKKNSDRSRAQLHSSIGYRYRFGSVVVIDGKDYDQYEYARRLKVTVESNATNDDEAKKVLSLAAVSYGQCEHLSSVFDEMVTALLANLYNENGSVTPVSVKTKRPCRGER